MGLGPLQHYSNLMANTFLYLFFLFKSPSAGFTTGWRFVASIAQVNIFQSFWPCLFNFRNFFTTTFALVTTNGLTKKLNTLNLLTCSISKACVEAASRIIWIFRSKVVQRQIW